MSTVTPRPARAGWAPVLAGAVAVLASVACAPDPPAARAPAAPATRPTGPPSPAAPSPSPTSTGPTVQQIAAALDAISTVRHPRDNTASCAVAAGCVGLVTAGTVSIYQWPTVSAAAKFIGEGAGSVDRIGPYVLAYRTNEQRSTSAQVRKAYADRVREMVGPVA